MDRAAALAPAEEAGERTAGAASARAAAAALVVSRLSGPEERASGSQREAEREAEIPATERDVGEHVVAGMERANEPSDCMSGVQYVHRFRQNLAEALEVQARPAGALVGRTILGRRLGDEADALRLKAQVEPLLAKSPIKEWSDDLIAGYADPRYFERTGFMSWRLRPGQSLSAAVQAWLRGLTLGECFTTALTLQYDAARAALGDAAFDAAFGGEQPQVGPLEIAPPLNGHTAHLERLLTRSKAREGADAGGAGHRPARLGEWYYFFNHPRYHFKHPAGAWQGENAIFIGEREGVQLWAGLGASDRTEMDLYREMVDSYNEPRTPADLRELERIRAEKGGSLPSEYEVGAFPDRLSSPEEILTAPPVRIAGIEHKGGFALESGLRVDPARLLARTGTGGAGR
jgi:hypothetical protein